MPEFIPAGILKKNFDILGHFYSVCLKSGERIDCRSVLEIVRKKNSPSERDAILRQFPDAIFIMMNPGSSIPLEEVNNAIPEEKISLLGTSLVPTRPDTTQYQVMRMMHFCDWDHVRVLNISDMRDPKSGKFIERYKNVEEVTGFKAHSIFSDERSNELENRLKKRPKAPIVCAWGVSPDLEPLIQRCLVKLSEMDGSPDLTGLLKPGTDNKYFHPLPTLQKGKVKWVNDMLGKLKGTMTMASC
ncbi:MAG: DUF1643 domain-containing protein [Nitrospiria bacterium]